jgi:hypothetical protein
MRVLFYGDACEKPTTEAQRHGEQEQKDFQYLSGAVFRSVSSMLIRGKFWICQFEDFGFLF